MGYTPEQMEMALHQVHKDMKDLEHDLKDVEHDIEHEIDEHCDDYHHGKEHNMGDIAGLLALMKGNQGMDLPGLLALCKDKGHDTSFGGGGMGLLIILLFFLMMNGGWGGAANRAAAVGAVGAENCERIIGIHDRISAAQAATGAGFTHVETLLTTALAELTETMNTNSNRQYDATRNLGEQMSACCCAIENKLSTVLCQLGNIEREIVATNVNLSNKIDLAQERTNNKLCSLEGNMNLGFERLACKMDTMNLQNKNELLASEVAQLRANALAYNAADASVAKLERFITHHYTPTASLGA